MGSFLFRRPLRSLELMAREGGAGAWGIRDEHPGSGAGGFGIRDEATGWNGRLVRRSGDPMTLTDATDVALCCAEGGGPAWT